MSCAQPVTSPMDRFFNPPMTALYTNTCGYWEYASWQKLPFDGPVDRLGILMGDATARIGFKQGCDSSGWQGCFSGHGYVEIGPLTADARFLVPRGQPDLRIISALLGPGALCTPGASHVECSRGSCQQQPSGQHRCVRHACADETDNDGDGLVDYPADPGCSSVNDGDELDPPVAPVCSNGIDDDADGRADWPDDPGCASSAGPEERGAGETARRLKRSSRL